MGGQQRPCRLGTGKVLSAWKGETQEGEHTGSLCLNSAQHNGTSVSVRVPRCNCNKNNNIIVTEMVIFCNILDKLM